MVKKTLSVAAPELAAQWHPTKNGNLTPEMVGIGSRKTVWWLYPYDDPKTGKHFDFEWEEQIITRYSGYYTHGYICPFLIKVPHRAWPGFNDLATTNPELAAQWHPTKNGNLKPTDVTSGSEKKIWWFLPYDDPDTGKHFDFEWKETVKRQRMKGCPFIQKNTQKVINKQKSLEEYSSELALQWHPTKNGNLFPKDISITNNRKVWWLYPYDDPKTGKHFDFEWEEQINYRIHYPTCPFIRGYRVYPGFNDLATVNPELAAQWHPIKNGALKPTDITYGSNRKVWWLYPYNDPKTGKHFDFEWEAVINDRNKYPKCPFLTGKRVWSGYNDLATTHPEIAAQWHPTKNDKLKPTDVTFRSGREVWWLMISEDPVSGEKNKIEWQEKVHNRISPKSYPKTFLP